MLEFSKRKHYFSALSIDFRYYIIGGPPISSGGPFRVHGGDSHHVKLDLPGFSTATVDAFTCCECGFTEFYTDHGGIRNVRNSGRFLQVTEREMERIITCSNCGKELSRGDQFCAGCGAIV